MIGQRDYCVPLCLDDVLDALVLRSFDDAGEIVRVGAGFFVFAEDDSRVRVVDAILPGVRDVVREGSGIWSLLG